jgi:Biotin-requiring enzyme
VEDEASEGMLFSSGLIAGGALMGVGVAALILGAGKSVSLANLLEGLRGDGIRIVAPADAVVKLDGKVFASGESLPVRSRRFETAVAQPDGTVINRSEVAAAYRFDGSWQRFESLKVEVQSGSDRDAQLLEFDPEARARTIRFEPVPLWDTPIPVDSLGTGVAEGRLKKWLVEVGGPVSYAQPLAQIETAQGLVEIKSRERGRLYEKQVAEGEQVLVQASVGTLELDDPPISSQKPPPPVVRRRLVVEARPSSDSAAMAIFLFLCAILVYNALPRRGAAQ